MFPNKIINIDNILTLLFFIFFLGATFSSYYKYFYIKDYDYLIEAGCDPLLEECSFRDCEKNPDICPPNNLSYYKEYYVKAYDFQKCSDNSCSYECLNMEIVCREVPSEK
ncbi:MAG: hypothetical protein ABL899_00170 [Nitrospira sp.]